MEIINIPDLITRIESEYEELQAGVLRADSKFKEVIYWNSMNSLVMIVMVEYEYKVMITEGELKALQTIQDLAELITAKKA